MADKTKVERYRALCNDLNRVYEQRNHDYRDSFHTAFLEEGYAMSRIRLSDKLNRFKTLSRTTERKVADESLRETLMDLANYVIMTVLEMEEALRYARADELGLKWQEDDDDFC